MFDAKFIHAFPGHEIGGFVQDCRNSSRSFGNGVTAVMPEAINISMAKYKTAVSPVH